MPTRVTSPAASAASRNVARNAGVDAPNRPIIDRLLSFAFSGKHIGEKDLVCSYPEVGGNRIETHVDGEDAYAEMYDTIASAQETLDVTFFGLRNDDVGQKFADALIAKAQGTPPVEVNLMVDMLGSRQFGPTGESKLVKRLRDAGVNVIVNYLVNPKRKEKLNHPDHRKLIIADGKRAVTGGMNVARDYFSEWHDTMYGVRGPIVQQMQAEFLATWLHLGGKLSARCKTPEQARQRYFPQAEAAGDMKARGIQHIPGENQQIFRETLDFIRKAKSEILIEDPYVTNPKIIKALCEAASPPRNVKVTLVVPKQNNNKMSAILGKSSFDKLVKAGVNVQEYEPRFNHGKIIVVDGHLVSIGSSNLDDVALRHIFEFNLLVDSKSLVKELMAKVFDVDLAKSTPADPNAASTFERAAGKVLSKFHVAI